MNHYSDEHVRACMIPAGLDLESDGYTAPCVECGRPVRHVNAGGGSAWAAATVLDDGTEAHVLYCNTAACSRRVWECCSNDQLAGRACVFCGTRQTRRVFIVADVRADLGGDGDVATVVQGDPLLDVTVYGSAGDLIADVADYDEGVSGTPYAVPASLAWRLRRAMEDEQKAERDGQRLRLGHVQLGPVAPDRDDPSGPAVHDLLGGDLLQRMCDALHERGVHPDVINEAADEVQGL